MCDASNLAAIYGDCNLSQVEARTYFTARVPNLRGNEYRARTRCPLCNASNPSTLSIDFDRGLFYCHRCHAGGDAVSFERALTGADFRTARDIVFQIVGRPLPQSSESPAERRRRIAQVQRARAEAEQIARWRDDAVRALKRRWWQYLSDEQRACRQATYSNPPEHRRENLISVAVWASREALRLERELDRLEQLPAVDLVAAYRKTRGVAA